MRRPGGRVRRVDSDETARGRQDSKDAIDQFLELFAE